MGGRGEAEAAEVPLVGAAEREVEGWEATVEAMVGEGRWARNTTSTDWEVYRNLKGSLVIREPSPLSLLDDVSARNPRGTRNVWIWIVWNDVQV